MVSFQCNGCGDVLTKPKLDKHRAVCHTSFDCIDCSKRFESPADYKGHTSCISEAEKYQKSLYNGGGGNERNGRNQRSRQQGGGRQWGNNRPQWQQRPQGTGANDTPLGTPVRMSPVNDIPVVEENTQNTPAVEVSKKRKAEPEATESNDTSEPTKKKKKQKNGDGATGDTVSAVKSGKKRKSTSEVTVTECSPQNLNLQLAEERNNPGERGEKKEKKKKKKEKTKDAKEGEKEERKEKRKKKEDPPLSGQEPKSGATVDAKPPVTEVPLPIDTEKTRSAKKKSKSKVVAVGETPDVPEPKPPQLIVLEVAGARGDRTDREKRKKRQSGSHQERNGDGERVVEGNDDGVKEKRKEKKKKRRSEGQVAGAVE